MLERRSSRVDVRNRFLFLLPRSCTICHGGPKTEQFFGMVFYGTRSGGLSVWRYESDFVLEHVVDRLIDWLASVGSWLIDWLVEGLIDWLIDWSTDWLIDWLIEFSYVFFVWLQVASTWADWFFRPIIPSNLPRLWCWRQVDASRRTPG